MRRDLKNGRRQESWEDILYNDKYGDNQGSFLNKEGYVSDDYDDESNDYMDEEAYMLD